MIAKGPLPRSRRVHSRAHANRRCLISARVSTLIRGRVLSTIVQKQRRHLTYEYCSRVHNGSFVFLVVDEEKVQ